MSIEALRQLPLNLENADLKAENEVYQTIQQVALPAIFFSLSAMSYLAFAPLTITATLVLTGIAVTLLSQFAIKSLQRTEVNVKISNFESSAADFVQQWQKNSHVRVRLSEAEDSCTVAFFETGDKLDKKALMATLDNLGPGDVLIATHHNADFLRSYQSMVHEAAEQTGVKYFLYKCPKQPAFLDPKGQLFEADWVDVDEALL